MSVAQRAAQVLSRALPQAIDHVVKYMNEMRTILYGDGSEKPAKDGEGRQLALEASKGRLLHLMCTQMEPLGFEVRTRRMAPLASRRKGTRD